MELDRAALDRHITGNWGADNDPEEGPRCDECGSRTFGHADQFECEGCLKVVEFEVCSRPGKYGCGQCDACQDWADREYELRFDQ